MRPSFKENIFLTIFFSVLLTGILLTANLSDVTCQNNLQIKGISLCTENNETSNQSTNQSTNESQSESQNVKTECSCKCKKDNEDVCLDKVSSPTGTLIASALIFFILICCSIDIVVLIVEQNANKVPTSPNNLPVFEIYVNDKDIKKGTDKGTSTGDKLEETKKIICPICLNTQDSQQTLNSQQTLVSTKCKHVFHNKCISDWIEHNQKLSQTSNCPCCRQMLI
jgi:hypothetical protein